MKKKILHVFLTILITFALVPPALASTNTADISPTLNRISGQTRYDTSAAIAEQGWPNGSANCILAYGGNYPDSLAAAPLAKKLDAPILLTESSSLTPITKQTLIDLKTKNVTIVGGPGVISSSVDEELKTMGITTNRIYGNDEYETAVAVAQQVAAMPSMIFVCTSEDFADALSVSPIASIDQAPIILVPNNSIPDSVKDYIASNKSISKSYVIGSSNEIEDSVANQFPNSERISGNDEFATNIAVNKKFDSLFNPTYTTLASGEQFPDALSGGVLAAKLSAPIVLTSSDLPSETSYYYQQRFLKGQNSAGSNQYVYIFGGTAVVPDSVVQGMNKLITVSHLSVVNVTTPAGTAPQLPATVTAAMSDGTAKTVSVTWPSLEYSSYSVVGTFAVVGTIAESTTVKAVATVTVTDPNSVPTLTNQQVQKNMIGTWKTSDGKLTLEFNNDGTFEETQLLTGYTANYKGSYSIINPTIIRLDNSSWTEEDSFTLNGNVLTIYNMGISQFKGSSTSYDPEANHNYMNSTNPINYTFMKVN